MLGRRRSDGQAHRVLGALDVGTSKVCCLIVACGGASPTRLLGVGHHRTEGLKAGVVLDPDKAERSIRAAVAQAERMAGLTLNTVHLAVTSGRLKSANIVARAALSGRVVARGDIARVMAAGEAYADRTGRTTIQISHSGWTLDEVAGVRDPLGMAGREISLPMHIVTVDDSPLRNTLHVVERCYLETEGIVAAPFASAIAVTSEEERRSGVVCIDLGAGTTTLAIFSDQRFVYADGLPTGGGFVTSDIAREFSIPLAEAERIKTLYGTVMRAHSDACEVITLSPTPEGDTGDYQTTRSGLTSVIEGRMQAIYDRVAERLAQSRLEHLVAGHVVLTGGASQLVGLAEWWSSKSGATVRVGRPRPAAGFPEGLCNPAFAAAAGLVHSAATRQRDAEVGSERHHARARAGYFGRMRGWIREGF